MRYEDARRIMQKASGHWKHDPAKGKVIGNNTRLRYNEFRDYYSVRLHGNEILKIFPDRFEPYDAVGISIMTPQRAEAVKILKYIKSHDPDKKVVAGGPHAKYYFEEMMSEGWDHVIVNDGERAVLNLIDGTLAMVDFDSIPPNEYAQHAVKPARLENQEFLRTFNYRLGDRDSTTLMTARGCPEHCTFCEDAKSSIKWTPFDLVIEELDDIVGMGYKGVYIFDDIFSLIKKKAEPTARAMKERDLIYRCNGQARLFNEDFAQMLAETGCHEIAFGAESGSQKILDNIKKRCTIEQNYEFVRLCNKYGITCKAFLMLGLPGEDEETIKATERFIETAGINDFQLAVYYPYKGTQIRDSIDRGEDGFDLKFMGEGLGAYGQAGGSSESVVATEAFTAEQLLEHRDRIVKEFRPKSHVNKWATANDHFFDEPHKRIIGETTVQ